MSTQPVKVKNTSDEFFVGVYFENSDDPVYGAAEAWEVVRGIYFRYYKTYEEAVGL